MIETEQRIPRPMRPEDVTALLAVFSDPKAMAPFGGIIFDPGDVERWVRRNLAHQKRFGYGLFTLLRKQDGPPVGDCGPEHLDDDTAEAELGDDLRGDRWGRGLATEAAAAVRDHAVGALGISRPIGVIRHGNDPSRWVAEWIGMRPAEDVARDGRADWHYARNRNDPTPMPFPGADRAARLCARSIAR